MFFYPVFLKGQSEKMTMQQSINNFLKFGSFGEKMNRFSPQAIYSTIYNQEVVREP